MRNAQLKDLERELWVREQRDAITWTTKEGQVIPIKEMSDQHLKNLINLIKRRIKEKQESYTNEWYGDNPFDHIGDMDPLEYYD